MFFYENQYVVIKLRKALFRDVLTKPWCTYQQSMVMIGPSYALSQALQVLKSSPHHIQ